MSTPKRHHFVPQFYLKRFTSGKRYIRCLHRASGTIISRASIKGQCAIDNFYGWQDNIEWSLGAIEARAANLFRKIDIDIELPDKLSFEWQEILIFMALQSSRTQLSGRESDEMSDYYFKLMHQYEAKKAGVDLTKFRIGSQFPAALPMQLSMQAYPALNALDRCLLINKSRMPFLTSDNPVVHYNSRFSTIDRLGIIGLTSEGLQIFYAISPFLMIMLFDPSSYRRPSNAYTKVLRETDVIQLNILQYLWSGEVVFWQDAKIDSSIREISRHCKPFLPYERSVTRESDHIDLDGDKKGSLLHSYRAHAPLETRFRFIKQSGSSVPSGNLIRGAKTGSSIQNDIEYTFTSSTQPRSHLRSLALSTAMRDISRTLN